MVQILKDSNVADIQRKEYRPSPAMQEIKANIDNITQSDIAPLSFFIIDDTVHRDKDPHEREALQKLGNGTEGVLRQLITLLAKAPIELNYKRIIQLFNTQLSYYHEEHFFATLASMDKFTQYNQGLSDVDLGNVCKKIAINSGCLDGLVASLERVSIDYNLHKEVLEDFIEMNGAFLTSRTEELHLHPTAQRFFSGYISGDMYSKERVICCTEKYELMLFDNIFRLPLDTAVNHLVIKLQQGIEEIGLEGTKIEEAGIALEELRDTISFLQVKNRERKKNSEVYSYDKEADFIETEEEYIEALLKFLSKSKISIKNREDPLYCILSYPKILFNLEDKIDVNGEQRVSIRSEQEIRESLIEQFKYSVKEVDSLNTKKIRSLFLVFQPYIRDSTMPESRIKKIEKIISKNSNKDSIKEKFVDFYSPEVSNKSALAYLGQKVEEQLNIVNRDIAITPATKINWQLKLEDAIINGADSGRLQMLIRGHRREATKNNTATAEKAEVEIARDFLLLTQKHKERILLLLKKNDFYIDFKSLIRQAILESDMSLIEYIFANYQIKLTNEDISVGNYLVHSLSSSMAIKETIIKICNGGAVDVSYLLGVSGILFIILRHGGSEGYENYKEFKRQLGGYIPPNVYACLGRNNTSLAMYVAQFSGRNLPNFLDNEVNQETRDLYYRINDARNYSLSSYVLLYYSEFFSDFWSDYLNPETRKLHARAVSVGNTTLAIFVAQITPRLFKRFWKDWLNDKSKKISCLKPDNSGMTLAMYVASSNPEFFPSFWMRLKKSIQNIQSSSLSTAGHTLPNLVAKNCPGFFPVVWEGMPSESRRSLVEVLDANNISLTMLVSERVIFYFEKFYTKLKKKYGDLYIRQITRTDTLLAGNVATFHSSFFKKLWTGLPVEVRHSLAMNSVNNRLAAQVITFVGDFFPRFWNEGLTEEVKLHFIKQSATGRLNQPLAMLMLSCIPDYFNTFWRELTPEARKLCASQFSSLGESLATFILESSSEKFEKFWRITPPSSRVALLKSSASPASNLLISLTKNSPKNLETVWTDSALSRDDKREIVQNLGTDISKVLISGTLNCPRIVSSFWHYITDETKQKQELYKDIFQNTTLDKIIQTNSLSNTMKIKIRSARLGSTEYGMWAL